MALLTLPFSSETQKVQPTKRKKQHQQKPKPKSKQPNTSSWDHFKNLLTCKQMDVVGPNKEHEEVNGYSKLKSCSSICSFRDVVHGNTRVVHRADNSPESSTAGVNSGRKKQLTDPSKSHGSYTSCSRGMQFRKLSGCYECHAIVDPSRYTIPRSTICVCSKCGEVFPKMESLEHHQAVRHAVSELSPDDSGRNIVEIIFKSSWLKPNHPIFTIERILKVHNTRRTIQRFEDCRDTVKTRATATATRCAADGNELLRFHCTTVSCSLGSRNSSALCSAVPGCGVCTVIRHGFQNPKSGGIVTAGGGVGGGGVRTTASSGRAHDCLGVDHRERRAMLVCRVIAGKVKRVTEDAPAEEDGAYDSVVGNDGLYSSVEELYVFNPRAILPCFVVIYKAFES
ncbi:putative transcription factor C2H2 family [Helianthus annuus]|nr:putative transcription factor C2H2 family [Helianthus annuus]